MLIASAIQFRPNFARGPAEVSDNFRRISPLLNLAGRAGTNFLVLPELCLTGYSFLSREEAQLVAESWDGPTFLKMRLVAQQMDTYVSWGYVRIDRETHCLHNSATMVSPKGEIVARYDKVNLWGNDFIWATPGEEPAPVVETELGRASLVVCRDLRDRVPRNIPRTAAKKDPPLFSGQKVDLVAACVNWGKSGFPSTSWMDFVANNACTLVVANRWGEERNGSFVQDFGQGGSAVIEKDWTVHIGGLAFGADCVVTAVI